MTGGMPSASAAGMRLIQRYLPNPKHVEIHRITVLAPPAAAWEAARHFDGASIPWVRLLFDLRALPDRLRGRPIEADRRLGVDQVADSKTGFTLLEERAGREVVVGAIGQFWHLQIPFTTVPPAAFASFDAPGWGKVAWAIRVEPYGVGSQIVFELRTAATDDDSWRRLDRYYTVLGPASRLIRSSVMAHLEAELGALARPDDKSRALAGDELISGARYSLTHGIDIEAPPALVWPWLMQLGCDRGGWYSIDALDHGGVPSVEQAVPAWQTRAVGDRLATTPALDSFYDVLAVKPDELFAVGGEAARLGGHVKMAWAWVLEPLGQDATHLVTRVRARGAPRWSEWLQGAVLFPPVHALMQHAQLDHLRRLAAHQAQRRRP
jgi:hypothetical protein